MKPRSARGSVWFAAAARPGALRASIALASIALGSFSVGFPFQARTEAQVPSHPGVVLHETHTQSSLARVDTIHTYFTPASVLIVHAEGRMLLDLEQGRIALLDTERGEVRSMSLQQWDARLQEASGSEPGRGDEHSSGRFEAQGSGEEIAGFACTRYHHFGRRTLLGSQEYVEQQIWVTEEIDVPGDAYAVYRRAFDRVESIGFSGLVQRPTGVVLAVETRSWPVEADRRRDAQVERYSVYAVEQVNLPDSLFRMPEVSTRADSTAPEPAGAKRR